MTPQEEFDSARRIIEEALIQKPDFEEFYIFRDAWGCGVKSKRMGFSRVAPYYEDDLRNPYWLAGWDGIEFIPPLPPGEQN